MLRKRCPFSNIRHFFSPNYACFLSNSCMRRKIHARKRSPTWASAKLVSIAVVNFFVMFISRHTKFLLAKLLLATLLLQAFLPAWAAMQNVRQSDWTEVCVSSGIKWVKSTESGHAGLHTSSKHCLFCAVTGTAPEFDASLYLLGAPGTTQHVAISPYSVASVFPGHSLQSRAPPSFS